MQSEGRAKEAPITITTFVMCVRVRLRVSSVTKFSHAISLYLSLFLHYAAMADTAPLGGGEGGRGVRGRIIPHLHRLAPAYTQ